jgi:hypothetical protein
MVHRKTTLEMVRQHPRTAGYVITTLRDTPITTPGLFDDLGSSRFDPEDFRVFNHETLLLLLPPPRRAWVHGGDRRSGFDLHHHRGGEAFRATVCVSHLGATREKAPELHWRLVAQEGQEMASGSFPVKGELTPGLAPLGVLEFSLPEVSSCTRMNLCLSWQLKRGTVANAWTLWVHSSRFLDLVRRVHLHDPRGALRMLTGLEGEEDSTLWVAADLDETVRNRLKADRAVFLVQNSEYPLETKPLPFWREGIHLKQNHPLAEEFPFQDGGGEELLSLTGDLFFTGALSGTGIEAMVPILSRLDLHSDNFSLTHSLVELKGFPGRCLATTLRLAGGLGNLPLGLKNNLAGQAVIASAWEYAIKNR